MVLSTIRNLLLLVGLVCCSQKFALADLILGFEDFADGTSLSAQVPGLMLTNGTVLTAGISLNEFEFPPHAGANVAFDDGGPLSISFDHPILSFGGYFTYSVPLTLTAFDASNNQVASTTSAFRINVGCDPGPLCLGDPGSNANEFLSVAFAGGISRVTVLGGFAGSSFTLDDAEITATAPTVPEPNLFVLSLTALAGLLAVRQKAN